MYRESQQKTSSQHETRANLTMSLANCASHYENYPCSRKQNILIGFHGAWTGITVSRIMYVLNRLRHIKTLQFNKNLLLDSLLVECWHRVRGVPGSIPSQGPRHTKDVIKMVPVVPLFSTQH